MGAQFKIPHHCGPDDIVHEVELGVIMNGLGREHPWIERIGAYVLLLDMTDRNHLDKAIATKTPWMKAKAQDGFLVLGNLIRKEAIADPHNVVLELKINGEVRQLDNTGNMNFKLEQLIAYMEETGPINFVEGDLLMTGTPEGVGPVLEGDVLEASLRGPDGDLISQIRQTIGREPSPM